MEILNVKILVLKYLIDVVRHWQVHLILFKEAFPSTAQIWKTVSFSAMDYKSQKIDTICSV